MLMELTLVLNWIKSTRDVIVLNVCWSRRCCTFGTWIGWIVKTLTTSTALLNTSAFSLRGYVDTLSHIVAMHLLDRSCVIVGSFFEITAFPNSWASSYFCSWGHGRSHVACNHVNLICVRYFDSMYVVIPLVLSCERRLHDTSPYLGLKCIME